MLDMLKGARLMVENCIRVKPGERLLVVADDELFPMEIGKAIIDVADSLGAEVAMTLMKPVKVAATEPPRAVAAAMMTANIIIYISNRFGVAHTDARKEATAAGARVYNLLEVPEDCFRHEITPADLEEIKRCTEDLAGKLTKARRCRVTSPAGTDVTMTLEGRKGLAVHPLGDVVGGLPDYAEAAISPVEGSAEGRIVVDTGFIGWGYVLSEPVRCQVKRGKMVEITGGEDAAKLRGIAATDENASNIAELGLGTSHTIPRTFGATRRDAGITGNVHIAIGRNNGIGGQTYSKIHVDGLLRNATVELDGRQVIKGGRLI